MRIRNRWLIAGLFAAVMGIWSGYARAQHVDVLVAQLDGRLTAGSADFDHNEWTLGQRVFVGEFDGDFAVNSPGFHALAADSPALPAGSQALPGNTALGWDFLPMTLPSLKANLLYWNGLDSDGVAGLTPNDVRFGSLPGSGYTLGLFDQSSIAFNVNGAPILAAGGVIDDTDAEGFMHRHRFYQLLDNDGSSSSLPADGIYLFALQLRMSGLSESKPIYMVFGTPGSSVAALDSAAVPWIEARVESLIGTPGDYNLDGAVDAADFVVWRNTLGSISDLAADGDMNGAIELADYMVWRANFGTHCGGSGAAGNLFAVPEASGLVLMPLGFSLVAKLLYPRKNKRKSTAASTATQTVDTLNLGRMEHDSVVRWSHTSWSSRRAAGGRFRK